MEWCIDLRGPNGEVGQLRVSSDDMFNRVVGLLKQAGATVGNRAGRSWPELRLPAVSDEIGVEFIVRVAAGMEFQPIIFTDDLEFARRCAEDARSKRPAEVKITRRVETTIE